jgi:hypothetical protein
MFRMSDRTSVLQNVSSVGNRERHLMGRKDFHMEQCYTAVITAKDYSQIDVPFRTIHQKRLGGGCDPPAGSIAITSNVVHG